LKAENHVNTQPPSGVVSSRPKRRRRKRTKNLYFTKVHERAIIEYCSTQDIRIRTELYESLIQPAFSEMVDKIIFTYKFNILPNIDFLKDDCKIWLTTILNKYDPNKGSKAFSYFSVVTKNWFIHKVKQNSKKMKREVSFENLVENGGPDILGTTDNSESYLYQTIEKEFWESLLETMDSWDVPNLKKNEKIVLDAVRVLFHNIEDIEIFNKKAVYLYLRELTGLNTKQVVNNLNKIREKYRTWKTRWIKE
tara:strand:- start:5755 stop:6507 length:753 start_codon:yes stop_codon:yes gene_type:complete